MIEKMREIFLNKIGKEKIRDALKIAIAIITLYFLIFIPIKDIWNKKNIVSKKSLEKEELLLDIEISNLKVKTIQKKLEKIKLEKIKFDIKLKEIVFLNTAMETIEINEVLKKFNLKIKTMARRKSLLFSEEKKIFKLISPYEILGEIEDIFLFLKWLESKNEKYEIVNDNFNITLLSKEIAKLNINISYLSFEFSDQKNLNSIEIIPSQKILSSNFNFIPPINKTHLVEIKEVIFYGSKYYELTYNKNQKKILKKNTVFIIDRIPYIIEEKNGNFTLKVKN